jgi:hypothetical protein
MMKKRFQNVNCFTNLPSSMTHIEHSLLWLRAMNSCQVQAGFYGWALAGVCWVAFHAACSPDGTVILNHNIWWAMDRGFNIRWENYMPLVVVVDLAASAAAAKPAGK